MQQCLGTLTDLNDASKVLRSSQESLVASSVFKYLLNKENLSTILSLGIGSTSVDLEFLECLSNTFSLSISEKLIVGLVLTESENPVIGLHGILCSFVYYFLLLDFHERVSDVNWTVFYNSLNFHRTSLCTICRKELLHPAD